MQAQSFAKQIILDNYSIGNFMLESTEVSDAEITSRVIFAMELTLFNPAIRIVVRNLLVLQVEDNFLHEEIDAISKEHFGLRLLGIS